MAASPSSVISLGLGSWGSPSLVITLGYGGAAPTTDACSAWPRGAWPDGAWPDTCPVEGGSGGGGLDPGDGLKRRKRITKPTGLLPARRKAKSDAERVVDERIEQSVVDRDEISRRILEGFTPVSQMSEQDIADEIGKLLRAKIAKDQEEALLLLVIAASIH